MMHNHSTLEQQQFKQIIKNPQLQWCDECMAISYHICTTKKTMVEKKVHHHLIF